MQGIRHLIQCRCFLPQFKARQNPPIHQFAVFSIIDDDDNVIVKYAQCNNCGVIHRVVEINKSEILSGKEHMSSLTNIDDIKLGMNERIVAALETASADISIWEQAAYIFETQEWGHHIVLNKDIDGDEIHVKTLRVLGPDMFKVETNIFQSIAKE